MKELKVSETRLVKRSEIELNMRNPKIHSEENIKTQLKNIKANGILGGLVFNQRDGKLISGHKRIMAMDMYYKYDGTPETDYEVKVEVVDFDEKTALEQMTFMSGITDTKADYNRIADYIDDIDFKVAGLSEADYKAIVDLKIDEDFGMEDMETMTDGLIHEAPPRIQTPVTELPTSELTNEQVVQMHDEKPAMTKEQVKAAKQHCQDVAENYMGENDLYIVLSFDSIEQKCAFCEALGIEQRPNMTIRGGEIMRALDL